MRKIIILFALCVLVSCSKDGPESPSCHSLRISIDRGSVTRAPGDKHTNLTSVMIMLYPTGANAGMLYPYRIERFTPDPANEEEDYVIDGIAEGRYYIYAFGNYTAFGMNTSLANARYASTMVNLLTLENIPSASQFHMINVDQDKTVHLTLIRMAALLEIGSVGMDLSECPAFAELNPKIGSVFLINLTSSDTVCWEGSTGSNSYYLDGMAYKADQLVDRYGYFIDYNNPGRYFYGQPFYKNNGSPSESFYVNDTFIMLGNSAYETASVDGEDHVTKLVVAVTHDNGVDFYPIGIPGVTRSMIYRISDITIRGRGSDHPNRYVGGSGGGSSSSPDAAVTFNVEVQPWTVQDFGQLSY